MKKTLLTLTVLIGLLALQASAQITVSGTSGSIGNTLGTTFDVNIQLAVADSLPTNVTALNLLLATPTTGANSGVGHFDVFFLNGSTSFPTENSTSSSSNRSIFDTPDSSGANSGFTISTPTFDLGANAGGGGGVATPFGATNVDTLRFTLLDATPGTYNFVATVGWPTDVNGSFINDAGNDGPSTGGTYAVSNASTFSITVVPEPATWSLLILGGLGTIGLNILRRKRA